MFSTLSKTKFAISATFELSSANAFNLDKSKCLSSGKELIEILRYAKDISKAKISMRISMRELLRVTLIDIMYRCIKPFTPKRQILDSSKLNEFANDTFKLDENGRKFSKRVENTEGKGEIARNEQFLLFPQCFQKTCTADT